jgi:hypothetical protein
MLNYVMIAPSEVMFDTAVLIVCWISCQGGELTGPSA